MAPSTQITLYPARRLRIITAYLIDALLAIGCGLVVGGILEPSLELRYWAAIGAAIIGSAALQSVLLSQRGARTLGRRLTGIIVVSADGQKVSLFKRLIRFPLACLSWSLAGVGILWLLFDPMHRTWHDILTGTVEVPRIIKVKSKAE